MSKRELTEEQDRLLPRFREICRQGQAEAEPDDEEMFLKRFLPIRAHFRVLDSDVRIIIGDKGSGKTHLFRTLEIDRGREALVSLAREKGLPVPPLDQTTWLVGYCTSGKDFPPGGVIGNFARGKDTSIIQNFWLTLLVEVLLRAEKISASSLPLRLREVITSHAWDLEILNEQITAGLGDLFRVLDSLDSELKAHDEYVFVSYDELDLVSPGDWGALKTILQGLVQFWAAYGRRWRHIRPKIFLRRDLYQRIALFGPDIAKIASNRADLLWGIHEFYGVLFKRLLNENDFYEYLTPARIQFSENDALGKIPRASREEDYKSAVNRMFGEYMGTDPRKGLTLRWIPNHLKDGHGQIYPRPLLRLLEDAAEIELRDRKAKGTVKLLHHTALRGALDKVSEFRVQELAQEEFPWIETICRNLEGKNLLVPGERYGFVKALKINWSQFEDRPPDTQPGAILDYLVELGIFSNRRDGRVDVGDLYLRGLHLKRKGGVARPKKIRE
jgi:hypothetical protein